MRHFAASLILPALLATAPAAAQDKPFQGPVVTVIGGVDGTETLGNGKAGALYGGQLGYDWQSNTTVVGVEGEVSGTSTKNCDFLGGATGAGQFCFKGGRDFYAGGRIGKVVGASTLLYAKAGYTNFRQSFDYRDPSNPATNSSGGSANSGYRVGAGLEKAIGGNMSLKTEYRYSDYGGGLKRHQGVVGVGLRF